MPPVPPHYQCGKVILDFLFHIGRYPEIPALPLSAGVSDFQLYFGKK